MKQEQEDLMLENSQLRDIVADLLQDRESTSRLKVRSES